MDLLIFTIIAYATVAACGLLCLGLTAATIYMWAVEAIKEKEKEDSKGKGDKKCS